MKDPNTAVDFIIKNAGAFAEAKANRVYIENYLRSKKALLMAQSGSGSIAGKEVDAYAHPEYLALLDGLKEAVKIEERLRWELTAAQTRVDVWRTQESSNRAQDRAVR